MYVGTLVHKDRMWRENEPGDTLFSFIPERREASPLGKYANAVVVGVGIEFE